MLELSSENTRREHSWAARLRDGLTKRARGSRTVHRPNRRSGVVREIETALVASDAGGRGNAFLLAALRERASQGGTAAHLKTALRAVLVELLAPLERTLDLSGKNVHHHAGRRQRRGKDDFDRQLARYFQRSRPLGPARCRRHLSRRSPRAARCLGREKLVAVVAQSGGDPGAVSSTRSPRRAPRGIDVVIADTAGRLPSSCT